MSMLLFFTIFLRRVPVYLPIALRMYTCPLLSAAGYLEDAAGLSNRESHRSRLCMSDVGLTGEGFWVTECRATASQAGRRVRHALAFRAPHIALPCCLVFSPTCGHV
jgi:hypothetical protein